MKISGFSICRNAVKYDYPIVEVINSALPLVDEFIVNVGQSDDGTLEIIQSIRSPKVKIVNSWWDDNLKKDGLLFSKETNVALSHCSGEWALYLQADEVLHEQDYDRIFQNLQTHVSRHEIYGFTFQYKHFYGDFVSLNPWAYHRAVRIIRNDGSIESCGDAVGFCLKKDGRYLQSGCKENVRPSGGTIYHYGWVKDGRTLRNKFEYQIARHHGEVPPQDQANILARDRYDFSDYDIMKTFQGTHPSVMLQRVQGFPVLRPGRNRWLCPRFYREVLQRGFRG